VNDCQRLLWLQSTVSPLITSHFCSKAILSNFDLKFCPHKGLSETSLNKKFQKFWTKFLWDTELSGHRPFFIDSIYSMHFFENLVSRRDFVQNFLNFLCKLAQLRPLCGQNFKSKFESAVLLPKWAYYRENSLKARYLLRNKSETRTFFNHRHSSLRTTRCAKPRLENVPTPGNVPS
jgi:hypothetical protein